MFHLIVIDALQDAHLIHCMQMSCITARLLDIAFIFDFDFDLAGCFGIDRLTDIRCQIGKFHPSDASADLPHYSLPSKEHTPAAANIRSLPILA